MNLMKASIAHGIRPTALILGKDSGKPWSRWDTVFATAYQRFLSELCQQCGYPVYICHSDDNRIHIKALRDECEVSKVSERRQAEIAKENKDSPLYGTRVYGQPYLLDEDIAAGLEFVDLRRPYYEELAKKRGLVPEKPEPGLSE